MPIECQSITMETYFYSDIINIILHYLDKDSSFHYLNTTKTLQQFKKILYGKYLFDHELIIMNDAQYFIKYNKLKNDNSEQYIKNLKSTNALVSRFPNLVSLTIHYEESLMSFDALPKGLQSFKIISKTHFLMLGKLPNSLKFLEICNANTTLPKKFLSDLPINLETLILHSNNSPLDNLPKNLKKLEIDSCYFDGTLDKLPPNLEELKISSISYNNGNINKLPNNLKFLDIGVFFPRNVIYRLPAKLQSLRLNYCYDYNQFLSHLPDTLELLDLFTSPFNAFDGTLNNLPSNLKLLKLSKHYPKSLDHLSKNIEILFV